MAAEKEWRQSVTGRQACQIVQYSIFTAHWTRETDHVVQIDISLTLTPTFSQIALLFQKKKLYPIIQALILLLGNALLPKCIVRSLYDKRPHIPL